MVPARSQYADDSKLQARQRLWRRQDPPFDLMAWVVDLAGIKAVTAVLDLGCGNGSYLGRLREQGGWPVGIDISLGMLASAGQFTLVNADATHLPFADRSFELVLAAHMLYHVPDLAAVVAEIRRVLSTGGTCLAVTNGEAHIASLRRLVENAVAGSTPGWTMRDPATVAFSLENGTPVLRECFDSVECLRPPVATRVVIDDAEIVADYVASVADHYQPEVNCPWDQVVNECRRAAREIIDRVGMLVTAGDVGVFVCR